MGMGQKHPVYLIRLKGEIPIVSFLDSLASLKKAAVNKEVLPRISFQQITRSSDSLRPAAENYFHHAPFSF
jgi:hypothetical protein